MYLGYACMKTLKLIYKDIMGVLKTMLKDPKFAKHLHFEGKVER
jgi:hypothetical protein